MVPNIFVFRHGESENNLYTDVAQGVFLPNANLTEPGIVYTDRVAQKFQEDLGPLDGKSVALYASSLTRTQQTLGRICEKLGIPYDNLIIDQGLLEVHNGDWTGKHLKDTWNSEEYTILGALRTFFLDERREIGGSGPFGGFGPFFRCLKSTDILDEKIISDMDISDMYDLRSGKIKADYITARERGSTSHADVYVAANSWLNEMFSLGVDYVFACSHDLPCKAMEVGRGSIVWIDAVQGIIDRLEAGESIYNLREENPLVMEHLGQILSTSVPYSTPIHFGPPGYAPFPVLRINRIV